MVRLSLSLLGAFNAILDGSPISGFKTDKVRALLATWRSGANGEVAIGWSMRWRCLSAL